MTHDLVGYLFGLLDPDERRRADMALRHDPAERLRLDRLRRAFAPLESDRANDPPPAGLADRTLAFIAARTNGQAVEVRPTPAHRAIPAGGREPSYHTPRWRRIDVAVAAAILVIVGGLGVSGIARLQERNEIARCQDNLRQMHQALEGYTLVHDGRFPQIQEQPPHNYAGAFVPILQEGGFLPAAGQPACPTVSVADPAGGYAYSLGYRDPAGRLQGLRQEDSPCGNDLLPILADRQVPASHRTGYNVLYIGGNVRHATHPRVGVAGDDIFLNRDFQVAPGFSREDSVLGPGHMPQ